MVPTVVSGLGIGCQSHKPQKARHTNVHYGQFDRHYSIKRVGSCTAKAVRVFFFRASEEDIKKDSHRDHRDHRGKILGALGVLGGKKYTLSTMKNIREYGIGPFSVAVIHGGPGASGDMAPVAKELALVCGILEPLQTSASLEGQLQELFTSVQKHADLPITLIGHSWGAWLSFLFAARYSSYVTLKFHLVSF